SLHLRLLADGTDWRAEFPPSLDFRRQVAAFGRAEAHVQHWAAILTADSKAERGDKAPDPGGAARSAPSRRRPGRRRGLAAVAAAVTVAALFAVVFQLLSPNGARPTGMWQSIGQFQAHEGEDVVVARSDPHVVYRLNQATLVLERSGDGGTTWRAVALPAEV